MNRTQVEFDQKNESELLLSAGKYSGAANNLRHIDGIIAGTTSYAKDTFNPEFHSHENPHLSLILEGGNLENRKQLSVERKVGDVMFFHSGELHKTLPATASTKNMNLELELSFLEQYDIAEDDIGQVITQNIDSKFLILKMHNELLENDCFSSTSIQVLLLSTITKQIERSTTHRPTWVTELAEILNDEWRRFPSLAELAASLKIHPVTISKYFTKYYGCTLGAYMRKLKIERSLAFVKNHALSLTEVAHECGFSDQSHFTRTFKKFTGHLPKEFRRL